MSDNEENIEKRDIYGNIIDWDMNDPGYSEDTSLDENVDSNDEDND